ncbi:hypothetical protein A33Q_3875 [Indibacter alkaliphilus LW1]|uniref:Uncharacterized protein n=1 Tax=Indibacter alkaliphilus (strain CCUG 57479 / KCTC 22604 / LW1) TaxID=1189612 RepID=S2D886_INDAL|nr:hypothetical protein A33Q_3875 [Indibacter alkaliphilus LW1]
MDWVWVATDVPSRKPEIKKFGASHNSSNTLKLFRENELPDPLSIINLLMGNPIQLPSSTKK